MEKSKVHYKMYKSGKFIMFCSITSLLIGTGLGITQVYSNYASADTVSSVSSATAVEAKTTTVAFPQSLLSLTNYTDSQLEQLGDTDGSQATVMSPSRFFYANFGNWQRAGNDWGDDRSQSTVGSATATFGDSQYNSSSPNSKKSFAFNSSDDNSGIQWSANLMPNTNYTLNFGSAAFGIQNSQAKIVILDAGGKQLASITNLKTGAHDLQTLAFTTAAIPDTQSMYSRVTVQLLGKFSKQQLNGDVRAIANPAVIEPETPNGTTKYYKVSDFTGQKLSNIIQGANNDSIYQFKDTANNNSRIVPTYSGYIDQTVTSDSISDVSQKFNFTAQSPTKWGTAAVKANYSIVMLNDVKVIDDLTNEANSVKQSIDNDTTLTADQKSQQKAAVDVALSNSKQDVSNSTTDTDLTSAKSTGIQNIDAAHQPGTNLADQKTAANTDLQKEHDAVVKAINEDPSLTTDEKKTQVANADKALSDGQAAVNAATDADGVNSALAGGKTAIDAAHQPGTNLADQKTAANTDLQKEHDAVVKAINEDPSLTTDEKKAQVANADKALSDGQAAVNAATDADGVNSALADGKTAIDAAHKPGTSVDDQKTAANTDLQKEHDAVVKTINEDPSLTTDERQKQVADADKALSDAQTAVQNATNADGINNAVNVGKNYIDAAYKPGEALDTQKVDANTDLQKEHDAVVKAINEDPSLTTDEKKAQVANADKALSDGQAAVNAATDADGVNSALADGKTAIDAAHKPGTSVDDQKTAANTDLQKEHDAVVKAINEDPSLTTDEKKAQVANADKALSDGQAAVNAATDADGVNSALAGGKTAIDAAHQPGTNLADQKTAANTDLQKEHDAVVKAINEDPSLTTDEKKAQVANADKALSDGQAAVNAATDADGVNQSVANGKTAIDAAHQPGTNLADQKTAANTDLQKEHDAVVKAINEDPSLTTDEKKTQVANADKALSDGQAAVNAATDADGVNSALAGGKTAIDAAHQPGTNLADQKTAANTDLQKEHDAVVKAINEDPSLTTDEKKAQVANADKALSDGQAAVNAATDADGVNSALADGKTAIDAAHKPGTSVDDQKTAANTDLQKEHDAVVKAINEDPSLTTDEKKTQVANADKALSDGQAAVNAATDADGVNSALAGGKTAIDAAHQPGTNLADQKTAANTDLQKEHDAVVKAINEDPSLTTDEKKAQVANADKALSDGQAAVNAATDADGVNQSVANGKTAIDAAHQPGTNLADQKTAANTDLQKEHDAVVKAINEDPSLTTDEKKTQVANADKALSDGQAAVNAATDADGVNQSVANGKTAIDAAHKPGTSVDDQKTAAKKKIDEEADRIKRQIDSDANLSLEEKNAQKAAADRQAENAKSKIDSANTADEINDALRSGIIAIDAEYIPGVQKSIQNPVEVHSLVSVSNNKNELPNTGYSNNRSNSIVSLIISTFSGIMLMLGVSKKRKDNGK